MKTKILALALALIMLFALAACSDSGNNNSGGNNNTPPPSETPSAPAPSTPSPNQTQGNGGIFNDGTDVPDNGTPPYVEPPLESHRGDKGYFYTTTDCYIVYIDGNTGSRIVRYCLLNFDTHRSMSYTILDYTDKSVFTSNEDAKESPLGIVVDNVEYGALDANPLFGMGNTIDEVISKLDELGYAYYVSQP